jgi:nucleoid-associated protein YgaU
VRQLRPATVGTATAGVLLVVAAPTPSAALATVRTSSSASDVLLPLIALVALLAWSLLAWLLVLTAFLLARRLPGIAGRGATAAAHRIAPATIRRLVEIALGVSVAAGVLAASPASASGPAIPPAPPVATASLDWPAASISASASASATPAPDSAPDRPVVVQPGDSLWRIAAAHLPAGATDRQVAQAWPAWWSANRNAVGAHPDLIHPGQQLDPPVPS